ncbi:MAG: asparagine synthase (glutamine-hydrolyzing) [Kiritimatiellia bacterium]|jgi:asparagine synthase (glutamine-hydrolysing)
MCAMAGFAGSDARQRVERMSSSPTARAGADGSDIYEAEGIAIARCGLGPGGPGDVRQPILSENGRLALVCNGTIHNSPELRKELEARGHAFATDAGVEVVLHLYEESGDACVERLRGMFGFALWDADRRRLLMARDPMGQKPFFYAVAGGGLAFASEIKVLRAAGIAGDDIDLEGLWHYMSLRYLPDDKSLFNGIIKLQAGHCAAFENGSVRTWRHWRLDAFKDKRKGSEKELTDELEQVLLEAVRLHLRSDVPVGAFLSGGIDSSLVAAMMATVSGEPFHSFSIGVKEQDVNELPWARMISSKYNLIAREEIVEANVIHKIPEMIHHMDEPADPFGVGVYLVSQVAARDVKVVLSGDGGDENFAGYDRFAGQGLAAIYSRIPAVVRRQVFGRLFNLVPESFGYKSIASKLKWLNDMSFHDAGERYARSMSFLRFTDENKAALFTEAAQNRIANADSVGKILAFFDDGTADELLDKMLYTDLMTRMPDHLLSISDRMGQAHGIEIRPPMIDHKVTEFAASLPCDLKLKGRRLKYILRQVAARYMPRELIDRPKQGFGFPIARWLRTDLAPFMQALFKQSRFVALGIFRQEEIDRLVNEHVSGKADHNFRLWILINLEIWHRMCFEGRTADDMRGFIDSLR